MYYYLIIRNVVFQVGRRTTIVAAEGDMMRHQHTQRRARKHPYKERQRMRSAIGATADLNHAGLVSLVLVPPATRVRRHFKG